MKIGITGAAGGLGRRATDMLGEDHELVLIDNVDPAQATVFDGSPPTLRSLEPFEPAWPYKRVDITSLDDMVAALDEVDVVLRVRDDKF
jgi:nucleoside-diphosphate-sugar epimerase